MGLKDYLKQTAAGLGLTAGGVPLNVGDRLASEVGQHKYQQDVKYESLSREQGIRYNPSVENDELKAALDWYAAKGYTSGAAVVSAGNPWPPARDILLAITAENTERPGQAWKFLGVRSGSSQNNDNVISHLGPSEPLPRDCLPGILPEHIVTFPAINYNLKPRRDTHSAIVDRPLYFNYARETRFAYFEVQIVETASTTKISVGVVAPPYPDFRLPGKHANSISWDGDNGFLNMAGTEIKKWSPLYANGHADAIIGCGIAFRPDGIPASVFFTREGNLIPANGFGRAMSMQQALLGAGTQIMGKQMHAAIGATGKAAVAVNFGERPFKWEAANQFGPGMN